MFSNPFLKAFLIFLSGLILSFSAPSYDLWFIAWMGLIPLFIIINTSKKIKDVVIYPFLFGFAYNASYLHWLFSIHPLNWMGFNTFQSYLISFLAVILVSIFNSLFYVLFASCVFVIKKFSLTPYKNGMSFILIITFLWLIIFNKLSACKFLLGFPWTLIEYSQYKNLYLIQIAEYFGSALISFLIVFFNLVVADFLIWLFNIEKISNRYISRDPGKFTSILISFSFIIILIFLSITSGLYLFWKNQQFFSEKSQTICVLQGNLPIKATRGIKLDINLARETYGKLINNNDDILFIAPEGALPTNFTRDQVTRKWLKRLALKKQSDLIFGSYCKIQERYSNCAAHVSLTKNDFSYYEKERLVPFGEFVPLSSILPEFLKRLASFSIGEGFSEGKQNTPFNTLLGKVGITICFELIFPSIIRKQVLQGAELLVNLSDLSWFSNPRIKQQFLGFAVFRAIENRRPIIISSNNGTSVFIDQSGKIKSQSIPNTQGTLIDWVNPNNEITFCSKYGW